MFYVIGNVYRGEGFTWVVDQYELNLTDTWKYSHHGKFNTRQEAEKVSKELNYILK